MRKPFVPLALALMLACTAACEKIQLENADTPASTPVNEQGNVNLHIIPLSEPNAYTLLSANIFDQNDKRVKNLHLQGSEATTGDINVALPVGNYRIVAIAHNGSSHCTISSPEQIKFADNKVTDTFYGYQLLPVADEQEIYQDIQLVRGVGALKIHCLNDLPENIKQIKFYYTGGSSTLDATTGYGCVNSRQTELRQASPSVHDYVVYTFPHEDGRLLKFTLSALDGNGNTIATQTLSDVSIKRGNITTYSGNFFDGESDGSFTFRFEDKWEGEIFEEFE